MDRLVGAARSVRGNDGPGVKEKVEAQYAPKDRTQQRVHRGFIKSPGASEGVVDVHRLTMTGWVLCGKTAKRFFEERRQPRAHALQCGSVEYPIDNHIALAVKLADNAAQPLKKGDEGEVIAFTNCGDGAIKEGNALGKFRLAFGTVRLVAWCEVGASLRRAGVLRVDSTPLHWPRPSSHSAALAHSLRLPGLAIALSNIILTMAKETPLC